MRTRVSEFITLQRERERERTHHSAQTPVFLREMERTSVRCFSNLSSKTKKQKQNQKPTMLAFLKQIKAGWGFGQTWDARVAICCCLVTAFTKKGTTRLDWSAPSSLSTTMSALFWNASHADPLNRTQIKQHRSSLPPTTLPPASSCLDAAVLISQPADSEASRIHMADSLAFARRGFLFTFLLFTCFCWIHECEMSHKDISAEMILIFNNNHHHHQCTIMFYWPECLARLRRSHTFRRIFILSSVCCGVCFSRFTTSSLTSHRCRSSHTQKHHNIKQTHHVLIHYTVPPTLRL